MIKFITATAKRVMPAAALIAVLLALAPASAQAQGAFSSMAGKWAGSGTITLASGAKERIRCQATYAVGDGGNGMNQNLRCASDSYNFTLVSNVVNKGGALTGTWNETTRNVSGTIEGKGANGRFVVAVNGPGFNANLALTARPDAQTINITSNSDMRDVLINLSR